MAKRTSRRERDSRSITTTLDIAIVTAPRLGDANVSLHDEGRLVKSALLYADSVDLISHSALLISAFEAAADAGESTLIEWFASQSDSTLMTLGLDPHLTRVFSGLSPEAIRLRRRLLGGSRSRTVRRNISELYKLIDELAALAPGQHLADLSARSGAAELEEAIDLGLLRYSPRGEEFSGDFESGGDYLSTLREFLSDPTRHLMFDGRMSELVRELSANGRIQPHPIAVRHVSEAGVGTDLIRRLPVFPHAPLSDLLAARNDLKEPLQSYRAGVAQLSAKLQYGPFDAEAEQELKELWERDVALRINELRSALSKTKLFKEAALGAVAQTNTAVGTLGAAALTMSAANLGPVASVVAGIIGGTVATAANTMKAHSDTVANVSKSQMYYLLELDRTPSR